MKFFHKNIFLLNLGCETSLYTWYKPWDNTSHMDYNVIKKCYELLRKYEKSYYENYISLNTAEKFPIPKDFNKEYEEYKKGLWKYEDYLKTFKDIDIAELKEKCETANATTWANNKNCWPVSKEEFLKTIWKVMSYKEFEKQQIQNIEWQRENMVSEQERYKEILKSMK